MLDRASQVSIISEKIDLAWKALGDLHNMLEDGLEFTIEVSKVKNEVYNLYMKLERSLEDELCTTDGTASANGFRGGDA